MALHTLVKKFLSKLAGSWASFWLRRGRHRLGDAIASTKPLTKYLIYRKGFFSEVRTVLRGGRLCRPLETTKPLYSGIPGSCRRARTLPMTREARGGWSGATGMSEDIPKHNCRQAASMQARAGSVPGVDDRLRPCS